MSDILWWFWRVLRAALAACGVALLIGLFAMAIFGSKEARAQTAPTWKWVNCLPRDIFPGIGEGTAYVFVETDKVEGRVGWCRTDEAAPAGQEIWRTVRYQWCLKSKCLSNPANLNPFAVLDAIMQSADKFAARDSAVAKLSIPLVKGSEDERQFQIWWSRACKKLTTEPFPVTPPNGFSLTNPPTPALCPSEPPPPSDMWTAVGGTIFTYASGKLTGVTSKKVSAGTPGTCAQSQAIVGARIFCQIVGGPLTEVAEVVKQ